MRKHLTWTKPQPTHFREARLTPPNPAQPEELSAGVSLSCPSAFARLGAGLPISCFRELPEVSGWGPDVRFSVSDVSPVCCAGHPVPRCPPTPGCLSLSG